jgi:hypothetical protein
MYDLDRMFGGTGIARKYLTYIDPETGERVVNRPVLFGGAAIIIGLSLSLKYHRKRFILYRF